MAKKIRIYNAAFKAEAVKKNHWQSRQYFNHHKV